MSNTNKCRVCLVDGAKFSIFENFGSNDSIHSKLLQCLQEKIEDIEGYPRNICEPCNDTLNTTINFITKFRTSCKLLQSNIIIKQEICSDSEDFVKEQIEIELCKDEPESDWIEPLQIAINIPQIKNHEPSLTDIKKKLKGLKEINFKRKPIRKAKKSLRIASSILEAEVDWNGESLKSNSMKEPKEEKPREFRKKTKLDLPKPPKPPKQEGSSLCDICGEVFKNKDRLYNHRRHRHFNIPSECKECKKVFNSNSNLACHIKRVHSKKSLICDHCGRAFAIKSILTVHMRTHHLNKKQFKPMHACDRCDRSFTNAKSLVIHERSAHTGDRPAECMVCGASFYHEDYLKEHMRLHTGETPFKCPICGRGYAQRGNMRSHVSHNHRLADLSPEIIKTLKPSWFKYLKKP